MPGSLHAQRVSESHFEELRIRSDEENSGVEDQHWAEVRQIPIDGSIKKKVLCKQKQGGCGIKARVVSFVFFT